MKKPKILVIEDEVNVLKAIKNKLELSGYHVIEATNGAEGLAALDKKPDFILLDLYLPHMDGLEFLEQIKKRPAYKDIPIAIVTVSRGKAEIAETIAGSNVVAFFIKSDVRLNEIVEKIKEILSQKT
ncbi:response regulator [Patescibacteria group bacterium]|nr:response regulator [Patescibacteria group bacterium]